MTLNDDNEVYVTSRLGAACLVGVGAGLSSLAFAFAFGQGTAAFVSAWLVAFAGLLAWVQHRVYGGRR